MSRKNNEPSGIRTSTHRIFPSVLGNIPKVYCSKHLELRRKKVRSSSPEISLKSFSFNISKINFLDMPTNLSQHPALWGAKGGIWYQVTKWELSLSYTFRQSIVFKLFHNTLALPPSPTRLQPLSHQTLFTELP